MYLQNPIEEYFLINNELGLVSAPKKKQILLVDDSEDALSVQRRILKKMGAQVIALTSVEKATKYLLRRRPDIIVMDLFFQELNSGFELLTFAKAMKHLDGVPVVVATARKDEEALRRAFALGAAGYLRKPFLPKAFLREVSSLL